MNFDIPKTKEEIQKKIDLLKKEKTDLSTKLNEGRDLYSKEAKRLHALSIELNTTSEEKIPFRSENKNEAEEAVSADTQEDENIPINSYTSHDALITGDVDPTKTFSWDINTTDTETDKDDTPQKIEPANLLPKTPVLSAEEMKKRLADRKKKSEESDDLKKNSKIDPDVKKEEEPPAPHKEALKKKNKDDKKESLSEEKPSTSRRRFFGRLFKKNSSTKAVIAQEETIISTSPTSRRKFLKWAGIGVAGVMAGTAVKVAYDSDKKTREAKNIIEETKKTIEAAEEAKRLAAERVKEEERKMIEAKIEKMDMEFFKSLSYAGKIFYLAWLENAKTYLMLDKTKAELYVVGEDNKLKVKTVVGLGKVKGEGKNQSLAKNNREEYGTTPSQIYTLSYNISSQMKALYGEKVIWMNTGDPEYDPGLCIHPVFKEEYKKRKAAIDSPEAEDNRVSWGCVNVTNIDELREYITEGTDFVVLPDLDEVGREKWLDPDRGSITLVGQGDTDLPGLLTKIEEYATIKGDIV